MSVQIRMLLLEPEPGKMSFQLNQQDLLIISVAALVCIKTELLANRMVEWLAPVLGARSSVIRTLGILHKQRPGLLAKILMEQITLWTIIVLILVALTYTSVSITPFSHQPLPYPTFLIRFILDASVARFVVMATRIVLVRDTLMSQTKTKATPGQSGYAKLDFIYNIFGATCNLIYLGYHQNLLLGVTSAFMEVNSTPLECCRLIKQSKESSNSRSYRKTTILSFAICFICRAILPLLLLILATTQESPFKMDGVPLASFFICSIFYSSFNLLLMYHSLIRMLRSFHHSNCHSFPHSSSMPVPFSIHVLDNDNGDICQAKNDNYGYIHPSDNGDLYCTLDAEDADQMSIADREDDPRHTSLHRMIKSSEGDLFGKFRFSCYTGSSLDKGRSQDFLLGSQDLLSDNEPDVLMVSPDSEFRNYQQSEVDQSSDCEDYQHSDFSRLRDCGNYQQSTVDQLNESVSYQQSEISQSRGRMNYHQPVYDGVESTDNSPYSAISSAST